MFSSLKEKTIRIRSMGGITGIPMIVTAHWRTTQNNTKQSNFTWQQQNVKESGVVGHIHHRFIHRRQVLHPIDSGTVKKQQIRQFQGQSGPIVYQPVQRATSLKKSRKDTVGKTIYYQPCKTSKALVPPNLLLYPLLCRRRLWAQTA